MKVNMPEKNRSSALLTPDENDLVFNLLGLRCEALATTVVELYTTGSKDSDRWYYRDMGVLCLVKDNIRRSYFFRLFCLNKKQLTWEHEIYNDMNYLAPASFLHTFEAEDCIAAFNFADEDEGYMMRSTLLARLETRKRKTEKKTRNYNSGLSQMSIPGPDTNLSSMPPTKHIVTKKTRNNDSKEGKKKLTKADIGEPSDFKHVCHVGFDPIKGFDCERVLEPQLKRFFEEAGVSENQLCDRATREFIYDFIQQNGGLNAVAGSLNSAPPVPTRNRAPPPPPSRAPPAIPPPPPPPIRTLPPRSLPPSPKTYSDQVSYKPPPPPPVPGAGVIPQPPLPPPMVSSETQEDPRSALMEAIRSGSHLKPVSQNNNEPKKPTDSRNDLLSQIRQGIELKPVSQTPSTTPSSEPKGLAGALARALAERSKVIYSDSEDDEDEDEDEDEWEE